MGPEHPRTLMAMGNYGATLSMADEYQEAIPILIHCAEISRTTLGETHPGTLMPTYLLGNCYLSIGDLAKAESHLELAYRGFRELIGPFHNRTERAVANLIRTYERQGRWHKSADQFLAIADDYESREGDETQLVIVHRAMAGSAKIFAGDVEEGLLLVSPFRTSIQALDQVTPLRRAEVLKRIGAALIVQDRVESAAPYVRQYFELVIDLPVDSYKKTSSKDPAFAHQADLLLGRLQLALVESSRGALAESAELVDQVFDTGADVERLEPITRLYIGTAIDSLKASLDLDEPGWPDRIERLQALKSRL